MRTGTCVQLGWATPSFPRTLDVALTRTRTLLGVGDDEHSWGADGLRRKAWHKPRGVESLPLPDSFPVTWAVGDTIGVGADLEAGTISYSLNGGAYHVAFADCDFGTRSIFPAVSLKDGACEVNLGFGEVSSDTTRILTMRAGRNHHLEPPPPPPS